MNRKTDEDTFEVMMNRFRKRFDTEEKCIAAFKAYRDSYGLTCQKCGCKQHWWLNNISQYMCKQCRFRTTLRSGTLLDSTKLSYQSWFYGLFAYFNNTRIQESRLAAEAGLEREQAAGIMLEKIKKAAHSKELKTYRVLFFEDLDSPFVIEAYRKPVREKKVKVKIERRRGRPSHAEIQTLVQAGVLPENYKPVARAKKSRLSKYKRISVSARLGKKKAEELFSLRTESGKAKSSKSASMVKATSKPKTAAKPKPAKKAATKAAAPKKAAAKKTTTAKAAPKKAAAAKKTTAKKAAPKKAAAKKVVAVAKKTTAKKAAPKKAAAKKPVAKKTTAKKAAPKKAAAKKPVAKKTTAKKAAPKKAAVAKKPAAKKVAAKKPVAKKAAAKKPVAKKTTAKKAAPKKAAPAKK